MKEMDNASLKEIIAEVKMTMKKEEIPYAIEKILDEKHLKELQVIMFKQF
jgi:hypothetical protein